MGITVVMTCYSRKVVRDHATKHFFSLFDSYPVQKTCTDLIPDPFILYRFSLYRSNGTFAHAKRQIKIIIEIRGDDGDATFYSWFLFPCYCPHMLLIKYIGNTYMQCSVIESDSYAFLSWYETVACPPCWSAVRSMVRIQAVPSWCLLTNHVLDVPCTCPSVPLFSLILFWYFFNFSVFYLLPFLPDPPKYFLLFL